MSRSSTRWSPVAFPPRPWPKRPSASLRHWRESAEFYDRNKSRYLRNPKYRGKYIAIRHKRVVDVDADQKTLAHRLMERFPDHMFFVAQVLAKEPVLEVPGFVIVK